MEQRLKKLRIKKAICVCIALVICGLLAVIIIRAKNPTPMLPCLVALSVVMMIFSRAHNESKALRVGRRVLEYLHTRFENADYVPNRGVDEAEVRATGIIEGSWNRYSSTDFVSGVSGGVAFEQSRIILARGTTSRNAADGIVFMGRWMSFEHKEKVPCRVVLRRNPGGKAHKKGADFGEKFALYFSEPHRSERDISARIKSIALKADEIFTGSFQLCFDGERVLAAVSEDFTATEPVGTAGTRSEVRKEMLDPLKSLERDADDIERFAGILRGEK